MSASPEEPLSDEQLLTQLGWHAHRVVSTENWMQSIASRGYTCVTPFDRCMSEYGGLAGFPEGTAIFRSWSFLIDPTHVVSWFPPSIVRVHSETVNKKLTPIGTAGGGRFALLLASDDSVYAAMNEAIWHIADSPREALIALATNAPWHAVNQTYEASRQIISRIKALEHAGIDAILSGLFDINSSVRIAACQLACKWSVDCIESALIVVARTDRLGIVVANALRSLSKIIRPRNECILAEFVTHDDLFVRYTALGEMASHPSVNHIDLLESAARDQRYAIVTNECGNVIHQTPETLGERATRALKACRALRE